MLCQESQTESTEKRSELIKELNNLESRNLMTSALPNLRTFQDEREGGEIMHNWV